MLVQSPAPPPPSAPVIHAESRFVTVAARDIPLVLSNKAGRVENATVRYQLYIKTEVRALAATDKPPECAWRLTTHIQRQLCFTSMTGQFSCSDTVLAEQADSQDGHVQNISTSADDDCGLAAPEVLTAEHQLIERLSSGAPARFDADIKRNLTPMLNRAGAVVKRGA